MHVLPSPLRHRLLSILVSTSVLSLAAASPVPRAAAPISVAFPNQATPDAAWWVHHSPQLTIQAAVDSTAAHPLAHLAPQTPVVLTAQWTTQATLSASALAPIRWRVNSPDAALTPITSIPAWFRGIPNQDSVGLTALPSMPEQFVARRPGIYTVEAYWYGHWSVPMVITVGLRALVRATPAWTPPSAASTGVHPPLAQDATDPIVPLATMASIPGLALTVQRPIRGWLPIHGTIPQSQIMPQASRTATIQLVDPASASYRTWDYTVPLSTSGHFAVTLRIPWHGAGIAVWATVDLNSVFPLTLTHLPRTWPVNGVTLGSALITNPAPSLTLTALHHLASGDINLNQTPALRPYAQIAEALWSHAPSPQTGAVAIANWVADHTAYNFLEDEEGPLTWATATQTLQAGEGVCENYAIALAALYDSLGLSAHVVTGYARGTITTPWTAAEQPTSGDSHAWVAVRLGTRWLTVDPTWNSTESLPLNTITNAFTTQTLLFRASHLAGTATYAVNP